MLGGDPAKFFVPKLNTASLCFQKLCITPKLQRKRCLRGTASGSQAPLGIQDGPVAVGDAITLAMEAHGKIAILGEGIGGKPASLRDSFFAEGPDGAGYNRDTVQQFSPAVEILGE